MRVIAVYNNKGGVGKSLTTLFLADYFSSGAVTFRQRAMRVLVLDLDGQASSAVALLGKERVDEARGAGRHLAALLRGLNARPPVDVGAYLAERPAALTDSRKIPLGRLWVVVPERETIIELERETETRAVPGIAKRLRSACDGHFDIALVDLPANIDRRNAVAMVGLALADLIVIPTESSRVSLNALPDTFANIEYARGLGAGAKGRPAPGGILLNKTDRRTRQYRLHHGEVVDLARAHGLMLFKHFLPAAPALATASDDTLTFSTLRERYDTYYDNVRRVAVEAAGLAGFTVRRR